jgi:serine/threonine protein kinase
MAKDNDDSPRSKTKQAAPLEAVEQVELIEVDQLDGAPADGPVDRVGDTPGNAGNGAAKDEIQQNYHLLAAGDLVGEHYQIEAQLGKGGMSTVYRARHLLINRTVALKVLNESRSSDPKSVQRFQQEAKVISQLDHPNIVRLHEFGIDSQDRPYLVMDLVEGQSLEEFIKGKGKLGPKEALEIAVDVAEALDHAHEKGIIHRDLKPSNIVLEKGPSGRLRAKVVDFGIAKLMSTTASQKLTQTGDTFGSPTYMSPEQCMGKETDPRTDIYSLACVIVEMLTGKPLFEADLPIQVLAKHLNEKPKRLSSMKALQAERRQWTRHEATMMAALDRVLAKALSKNADDRYRNAAEFAQDLLIVLTDPSSLAKNLPLYISHLERKSLFGQSSYMVIGILTCALIYVVVVALYDQNSTAYLLSRAPSNSVSSAPPAPSEPSLPLPAIKVLPPTTFKPMAIMFDPAYVFDGIPAMHAYADTLRDYTESLRAQQAKGWATSQDQLQLARDSLNLGRVMVDSGNAKASINEFSRVIALQNLSEEDQKKQNNFSLDTNLLQSAYLGLGDARLSMGNFSEALDAYLKAKDFYTNGDIFDDKLKQGLLLRRIALCYGAMGDGQSGQKAQEYLTQAIQLLQIKDPQNAIDRKIIAAGALGDIYWHQGKYQDSLDLFTEALEIAKGLPAGYDSANAVQIAMLKCKRAYCLGVMGQTKESNSLFDTALIDLTNNRPDETYLQNLLKPRIAFARAIVLNRTHWCKEGAEQIKLGLAECRGVERDGLGLRLSMLKYLQRLNVKEADLVQAVPAQAADLAQAAQSLKEITDLEAKNATTSILPPIAAMQYDDNQTFSE